MYCKKCGKEIDDNAVVCPNCGVPTEKYQQQNNTAEAAPVEKKFNVCALIGFILSLCCWVLMWFTTIFYWIAFVAALTLSIVGLVFVKKLNTGKGFAIAGIILSAVSIVMWIIVIAVLASILASALI